MAWRQAAALAASVVVLTSCSGELAINVHPVVGRVLIGEQPAAGALVVFHPTGGADYRPRGYVQDDGGFELTTFSPHDGAPAGDYTVTVYWREQPEDDDELPGRWLAPKRYADPQTSRLTAEILPAKNRLEPFRLEEN